MKKSYKYGVEIECIVPEGEYELVKAKTQALDWRVTSDGSIDCMSGNGIENGIEIVTAPEGFTSMTRKLAKIDKVLDEAEVAVNRSCGLHVHLSNKRFFQRTNLKKIMQGWLALEDVFFATQPESRLSNSYCKRFFGRFISGNVPEKLTAKKEEIIEALAGVERYTALNLSSLDKHGTIEVRLHSGTTNKTKIINWLDLMRHFFTYCLESYDSDEVKELLSMTVDAEKISRAWDMLGLSDSLREYFNQRIRTQNFELLARQQLAGIKALEIKPIVEKLRKKVVKSREKFDVEQNKMHEYTRTFSM